MISKRAALKSAWIAGTVSAFSGFVPGLQQALAQTTRVRRNVNTMALDDPDLSTYRDFVGIMRNNSPSQLVSWVGFANVHGNENSFNFCPHGDWYFLPWHRAFVQMYETAAATLTKNPKFAMPYWDWTALRTLPAAFTDPTYKGQPNPLYVPGKGDATNIKRNALTGPNALTDAIVGPNVIASIYKETVFEAFGTSRNPKQTDLDPKWVPAGGGKQGILERTPHNLVHNNIGGYMPQSNSPRDPIFMMHHGNIDRIWATWNALGRQNSTDPLWLNMPFTNNYIAPNGTRYTRVVKDLLSTQALGYTYDTLPQPDNLAINEPRNKNLAALFNTSETAKPQRFLQANTKAASVSAHLSVPVAVGAPLLKSSLPSIAEANKAAREIVAVISDIKVGDNVNAIRVFVNRPSIDANVPDTDLHYVTTVGFLSHKASGAHAHHDHKALPSTIVDLTETLQALSKGNKLQGDSITV